MPVSRRAVVGFAGAGSALALAGCAKGTSAALTSDAPSASAVPSATSATPTGPAPVQLTTSITDGATVPVDTLLTVTASSGSITDVSMTFTDPKAGQQTVQGTLAPDSATWTAGSLLEPGLKYQVVVTGQNLAGVQATTTTTFSAQNLSLKQQIFPSILSGGTVGVAMPVVVKFDVPVTDRAAFQKHMTVTSNPAQEGSWGWQSSTEVHWRPKELWQAGTQVSIVIDVNSVPAGNGTYGQKSVSGGMTIARSVILNANLASHYLQVVIDGAVAKTIPITGGKPGFLSRGGKKVLKEKFAALTMNSETIGIPKTSPDYYNLSNVQYAMRETDSGEFLHAAPWSVGSQGKANVSHGCIGMSTANGAWLFSNCNVGDLINVTGTTRGLEKGNGWTDWNVSYDEFRKGSAL
ncbi:MAG TPA: Ig-like domain-containing protein [Propionibacteriaceae bacterium]